MLSLTAVLVSRLLSAPVAEWTAPAECPDADAVLAAAEDFGAEVAEASLELTGNIEAVEGGYRLDLEVQTPSGTTTRQLHAPSCAELARAAGLVLSVAVDPLRVPDPPNTAVPVAREPVVVEPAPVPAEHPTPPPRSRAGAPPSDSIPQLPIRSALVVSGVLGRGLSPAVDGRLQLGLAVDTFWVRAELMGFHAFVQSIEYADQPDVGARISAWGGSVRAGPRGEVRGIELACPLGIEVAAVAGVGYGVDQTWRRANLSWGVLAAPGLRVPLGSRVSIGLDAEAGVTLRRPAFTVDARDALYRVPRFGARGGARLEVRFFGPSRDQIRGRRRPR